MRYEEEGETLQDKSPCAGIRADLKMCLLESDCCKKVNSNGAPKNSFIQPVSGISGEKDPPGVSKQDRWVSARCLSCSKNHILRVQAVFGKNEFICDIFRIICYSLFPPAGHPATIPWTQGILNGMQM